MHHSVSSQALFNSTWFTNSKQPFFTIIFSRQGRSAVKKAWRDYLSWWETRCTWKDSTEEPFRSFFDHGIHPLPSQLSSKRAGLCIMTLSVRSTQKHHFLHSYEAVLSDCNSLKRREFYTSLWHESITWQSQLWNIAEGANYSSSNTQLFESITFYVTLEQYQYRQ